MQAQNLPETEGCPDQISWRSSIPGPVHHFPDGEVVQCDAFDLLDAIRNETADVVFLDPPFNLVGLTQIGSLLR